MEMSSVDTTLGVQGDTNTTRMISDLKNYSMYPGAENCRIIENNTRISWNHPGNLITWQQEELFYKVCAGLLYPVLFLVGTPANILNMVVFYRQGLKERINFCLFFLALIDILHLTPSFTFKSEMINSWFTNEIRSGDIYHFMLNNNLIGFYGFGYGSMLLASIISTERCMCVLFPFTAQHCIPTKVFAIVVVFFVFTVSLLRFVVTAQYRSACVYEVRTQRKSWQYEIKGDYFNKHKDMLSILEGVFFGFTMSVGCPVLVLITTLVTAIKLRQIVRWRSNTSSGMSSPKEIGLTKMLICLSIEFVVLSSPLITVRVTRLFPSVLNPGYHINLYRMLAGSYELCFYISSFMNFLVYYFTGTKYRETLHALLGIKKVEKKGVYTKRTTSSAAQEKGVAHQDK